MHPSSLIIRCREPTIFHQLASPTHSAILDGIIHAVARSKRIGYR